MTPNARSALLEHPGGNVNHLPELAIVGDMDGHATESNNSARIKDGHHRATLGSESALQHRIGVVEPTHLQ